MIYDFNREKGRKAVRGKVLLGILIAIAVIASIIASNIYLEIIQLNEIGNFSGIYLTNLMYQLIFSAASFLLIFFAFSLTSMFAKRNMKRFFVENNLEYKHLPNFTITLVISLIGTFLSKDFFYLKALSYINSEDFKILDPLFSKDIGYYIFQRPFLMSIYSFVSTLMFFIILYTVAYYLFSFFLTFNNVNIQDLKVKGIIRHNLINIAAFFLIKATAYRFKKEGILYSSFVGVDGAGYVDVNVWQKYFEFIPYVIILVVAVSLVFLWKGRLKKAAISIAVFPAVWVLVVISVMGVQSFLVKPNEADWESKYLQYNMDKTREAFNIKNVQTHNFPDMKDLSKDIINRNKDTINNVRVVDYKATLESNIQLQSNTNFYSFHDGDIANYVINGKEIPVLITAREIDKNKLPEKSYVNVTYKYTHGYGIVMNPVNRLTSQGQVEYIMSGLRMNSSDEKLSISEPRIYYGELTKDHVIVNAGNNLSEIDGDGSSETRYTGKGGIEMSLFNRLLFSLKYRDFNMLISGYVAPDSKLLLNREVLTRAQRAVPFLRVDNDPYIVISDDGRLKWVLDAYTTTSYYPYSQNYGDFNYIRNSVKIIIDAYDGSLKYYIVDKNDPMIKVYSKIYPGVFSEEPIPAGIAAHMRYPEQLFNVQTDIMRRYHLEPNNEQNVKTFYSKNDLWDIAKYSESVDAQGANHAEKKDIEPYYNMIKLPAGVGESEELILMRPFTPSGKNNMVSWLSVRNSVNNYGELILFNFPKNTNIFGPDQVDVKISQIDKVSKDISLWNQSGSTVFKGNLLVIPIEDSVFYVQPIYIKSGSGSSIPEVREIIVGYQKGEEFKYGIGINLDEALNQLFTGIVSTPLPEKQPNVTTDEKDVKIINEIKSKYSEMKKQIDELGNLIEKLEGK